MILRGMIFLLLMVGTFATFAMDELRQVIFYIYFGYLNCTDLDRDKDINKD